MSAMSDYLEVALRSAMFRTKTVAARANSTAYALGDLIMLGTTDLNVYECTTAGTSAASPPAFNTALGATTTDGTAVFTSCRVGLPKKQLYIALYTVTPSDAGGGTEVTGGSYARQALNPADANWSAPDAIGGLSANVGAVNFPVATASWGTIVAVGIHDHATAGNLLFWGALTANKTIASGDQFVFPATNLSVTFA